MKQCLHIEFQIRDMNGANPSSHYQHGWRLPLLVNGTTLLVQGEATQSPCVLALMFTVHQHDLSEGQEYTISLLFNSMIFATSANKPFLRCKSLASHPTVSGMIHAKPVLIADFSPVLDSSLSAKTNRLP